MEIITERLERQIAFILEIDKIKHIFRQNLLVDGSRRENDAEHSWHLALMAMILEEYSAKPINVSRVIKMVLIHDLVEIDAGDTFCYDAKAGEDKEEREIAAAKRLYGMLPVEQRDEFMGLWQEFEERKTPEAQFAACLDRLQPFLNNYHTQGGTWRMHNIHSGQVRERAVAINEGAPRLGEYVRLLIEDAVAQGILKQ